MAQDDPKTKRPQPGPYDVCVDNYRGYAVDPLTGLALNPFKCRDPRNAKRTNPKPKGGLDPDAPWGCD
jgi:hypothetical protein